MKIKNIEAAAERIKRAVQNKERIILYGDSDCDGICSVVLLQEAIRNIGGEVARVAFPNRENDGYGINMKALEELRPLAPALFITLDLGIGNVKEVDAANAMGFEVIIVDHHQILEKIPNASIIVDIQQPGDEYPFKELANVGITYKLAEEMLGSPPAGGMSEQLSKSFLELVALATVSDMVPQVQDNKIFIERGLASLTYTFRPAFQAFIDILGRGNVAAGGYQQIISAINAGESHGFNNDGYELLTCHNSNRCRELAETLLGRVTLKQQQIKEIAAEVERRISLQPQSESGSGRTIIFEGDPAWKLVLAGPVASIIATKYGKPTFIFRKGDEVSVGSVRSLQEGHNSVEAMRSCAHLLETYGGHPKASGFRIKNENLEAFKAHLENYFSP